MKPLIRKTLLTSFTFAFDLLCGEHRSRRAVLPIIIHNRDRSSELCSAHRHLPGRSPIEPGQRLSAAPGMAVLPHTSGGHTQGYAGVELQPWSRC